MTYDHDPQPDTDIKYEEPIEAEYEEPSEFMFDLRKDGTEPGVIGHLTPEEVPVFNRIREAQMLKHGAVKVRGKGNAWVMKAMEQAKVEVHGGT